MPTHLYGTDEDAGFGGFGLDPTVSRYDQTNDPLEWARDRVTLINSLFDSLDSRMVAPGQSYARLRTAFTDLLNDRWYALLLTTKYIGGATTARDHRGDPSARPSVTTVPAARQREALVFLTQAGFGEKAYRFRPELLSRLGPDRWRHWGSNPAAERSDRFPGPHVGDGPAGLAPGTATGPRGAGPDPGRGASCRRRGADPAMPELFKP